MGEEIKIREEVSEKIKKKINNSNYPDEIKEFLSKILLLEFKHIDEGPRFSSAIKEEYENYIRKYAENWGDEQK